MTDVLPRQTGSETEANVAAITDAIDWVKVYCRKRSKVGDPLSGRRVRLDDGREGTITRAWWTDNHRHGDERREYVGVHVETDEKVWRESSYMKGGGYWTRDYVKAELGANATLLDAPQMTAPVRVRKVMARGTKEQIAQKWAALPPLSDEKRAEGYDRYIEFQNDVAAYRRWRIVHVAPALDQDTVDATPSESPRAPGERRSREDNFEVDSGYGL